MESAYYNGNTDKALVIMPFVTLDKTANSKVIVKGLDVVSRES